MVSSTLLAAMCIIGTWQYAGFRYDGHEYPNPNPNLILRFEFDDKISVRLKYYRINEPGFCERTGIYSVSDKTLYQKITWVNPRNNAECGRDPDMQMGRESETIFECSEAKLEFKLDLNGKEFWYKLERVDQSAGSSSEVTNP